MAHETPNIKEQIRIQWEAFEREVSEHRAKNQEPMVFVSMAQKRRALAQGCVEEEDGNVWTPKQLTERATVDKEVGQ